jgi:hypothetical protein
LLKNPLTINDTESAIIIIDVCEKNLGAPRMATYFIGNNSVKIKCIGSSINDTKKESNKYLVISDLLALSLKRTIAQIIEKKK